MAKSKKGMGATKKPIEQYDYVFKGVVHKYRPDFIIRLKTGDHLVLETKAKTRIKTKRGGRFWRSGSKR